MWCVFLWVLKDPLQSDREPPFNQMSGACVVELLLLHLHGWGSGGGGEGPCPMEGTMRIWDWLGIPQKWGHAVSSICKDQIPSKVKSGVLCLSPWAVSRRFGRGCLESQNGLEGTLRGHLAQRPFGACRHGILCCERGRI